MQRKLILIAAADLVVLGASYASQPLLGFPPTSISWAIAAVGLITFFGSLAITDQNTKVTTRFALTTSFAAVWFACVGALLFPSGQTDATSQGAFQAVSFVMSVVVVFYFGAQAYQAVGQAKAPGAAPVTPAPNAPPGGGQQEARTSPARELLD